ncbi:MAG: SMP-30/gluconolactonase/LRE family protein [Bacillota bacterium]
MKPALLRLALPLFLAASSAVLADDLSFTTLITTPLAIEGLTNDADGNLYTPGRTPGNGQPCPVWRIPLDNPSLTIVGLVPAPSATTQCSPSGLAFGPDGKLYVTETDRIYRFTPNASSPPTADLYASGVPGTNGLAFDRAGNLWTGDGTTGQGRIWKITTDGTVTEVFRVQPMANEVNLVSGTGGIGRDVRSLGPGTIAVTATSRNAANTAGSQPLVANGVLFDRAGTMFIADTARGAIWRVRLHHDGTVASRMGCDTTFTSNTLCLDSVVVAHPYLEGADGFVMDVAGNIWVDANERNAVVVVTNSGRVIELFRNPPDPTTKLRNTGPLETPTSPVLAGHKFCTANSDGNRRDNFPNTAGEIGGAGQPKGKISCLDQRVSVPGILLPVE